MPLPPAAVDPVPGSTAGITFTGVKSVCFHTFQLQPFPACRPQPELKAAGTLSRRDNVLYLVFRLSGDVTGLILPGPEHERLRCGKLWQTTCFECFIRPSGTSCYHEVNFSPSGCWNLYRFSDYRTAMQEEPAVSSFFSEAQMVDGEFRFGCILPLGTLYQPEQVLEIGLSCVLEHGDGEKSYWALSHPGQRPDFHHPGSFGLKV